MTVELGRIHELFRYPVKSMAAQAIEAAQLGWHGLAGDRRFAFRRAAERGGLPWLTASRFPGMLLYRPTGGDEAVEEPAPTHVQTPEGARLALRGEELRATISLDSGHEVELMKVDHGIFDEATVSVISLATLIGIGRECGQPLDRRRFRPNIVLETAGTEPFEEDRWVGGTLWFGDEDGAAVSVTMRDLRCVMINLDPDTAEQDPAIMRTTVRLNANFAGIYGTVVRTGRLAVGQRVRWSEPR